MISNSENQINNRRNWKAETFDYDHYISVDSSTCLYCLSDLQAEALRGIISTLAWSTRWFSTVDTPIDTEAILEFKNELLRALMSGCGCDDAGTIYQYTPDGHYQSSADGGVTWVDSPQNDPRRPQPIYPPFVPPDTVDEACTEADGIVQLIKAQIVDRLEDGQTGADIIGLISGVLLGLFAALVPTIIGAIVVALLGGVVGAIVFLGTSGFQSAMTDDVYKRLKCNLQDHIEPDGSFSQSDVDAVYNQIGTDETGIAALFLRGVIASMGSIGLTNAARAGFGAADAECECGDCVGHAEVIVYLGDNLTWVDDCTFDIDTVASGGTNKFLVYIQTSGCPDNPQQYWKFVTDPGLPLRFQYQCEGTSPTDYDIAAPSNQIEWRDGSPQTVRVKISNSPFPP